MTAAPSIQWQPGPGHYKHLTASGLVKTGPGVLMNMVVNTASNAAITIYDGVDNTGAVIGVIAGSTPDAPDELAYNCYFTTGLYLALGAGLDVTVTYQ